MKHVNTITVKIDTKRDYLTKSLNVLKECLIKWTEDDNLRYCPFNNKEIGTCTYFNSFDKTFKVIFITTTKSWFKNAGFTDEEINTIRVW